MRIVQKSGRVFLETTVCKTVGAVRDEKVERMDLGFISEEPYSQEKHVFH